MMSGTDRKKPLFGSALLLAGGKSLRMGFDKQTLCFDGERLPVRLIRLLSAIFDEVIVATDKPHFYRDLSDKVRTVADTIAGMGPLGGLHAGLIAADSRFVYVTGCDMPYIDARYISLLQEHLTDALKEDDLAEGIAVWRADGRIEPLGAFYSVDLKDELENRLSGGNISLNDVCRTKNIVRLNESAVRTVVPSPDVFFNLNRPDDFRKVAHLLKEKASDRSDITDPGKPDFADKKGAASSHACDQFIKKADALRVTRNGASLFPETLPDEAHLRLKIRCEQDEKEKGIRELRQMADGLETRETSCKIETFYLLPDRLDDFVTGHLFSSRLIRSCADITAFNAFKTGDHPNDQDLNDWEADVVIKRHLSDSNDKHFNSTDRRRPAELPLAASWFLDTLPKLDSEGSLFMVTGGTHVLAFYDVEGCEVDLVEDVSRHVAFDKLIGKAVKNELDFSKLILLTSCRLTSSIVEKAVKVGLPLLASRSAVTARALALARRHKIQILSFVREGRLNLFP